MISFPSGVKKWLGGLVLLLLLMGLAALACRWSMRCGRADLMRQQADLSSGIFSDPALRLSASQKAQIQKLEQEYRAKMRDCCARHCAARAKIGEILRRSNPSGEELQKLARDVGRAYSDSEEATVRHILEVGQVLAPPQRDVFLQKVAAQVSATCPSMDLQ